MHRKKSKYRHVVINKKKYYFYKISWVDITADGGHATSEEFDKFECSKMVSFAYVYKRTKKFVWTFASYDSKDEAYSDRNVFPRGVITEMEKIKCGIQIDYLLLGWLWFFGYWVSLLSNFDSSLDVGLATDTFLVFFFFLFFGF